MHSAPLSHLIFLHTPSKVLVVGFGLSPRVGHLPAARATLCAMECTDRLRARGLARCHAGVATGPVFCGSLGSEDRREFAMISETVNLAQRLMSARKSRRLLPKGQGQVSFPPGFRLGVGVQLPLYLTGWLLFETGSTSK